MLRRSAGPDIMPAFSQSSSQIEIFKQAMSWTHLQELSAIHSQQFAVSGPLDLIEDVKGHHSCRTSSGIISSTPKALIRTRLLCAQRFACPAEHSATPCSSLQHYTQWRTPTQTRCNSRLLNSGRLGQWVVMRWKTKATQAGFRQARRGQGPETQSRRCISPQ